MIRYTPQAQLTLEGFQTPFCQHLDKDNRWIKLADCIPWDKLAYIYYRKMDSDFGAPSLSARMVIGAVIIKHMLNIDDREVVAQIQENMYLQYFVGLSSFTTEEPFDASLMVSIRYRLGQDVMEEFNQLVLQEAGVIPPPSQTALASTSFPNEDGSSGASSQNPNGPYALSGHCLGGIVAFEMTRQMEKRGKKIELLAMFDAFAPSGFVPGKEKRAPGTFRNLFHIRSLTKKPFFKIPPRLALQIYLFRHHFKVAVKYKFICQ